LPICKKLGIGLASWSHLAMGYLTGNINQKTQFKSTDYRARVPWFEPQNVTANFAILNFVKKWAEQKNATPARISLEWLLAQSPNVVPITGTTKMNHLLDNLGADGVHFTAEEISKLNADLQKITVHGARLPDAVLSFSGVEAPPLK
jgi:aryl-alcohol dehydrogenase-like predicted oxidoreductase